MIKRLSAVVLAFTMLHLTVALANADCSMHEHDAAAGAHAGMHHDGGHAPAEKTPCDTPVAPKCCQALVSCAPILAIDEGSEVVTTVAIAHAPIAAAVSERPLSRSTAPEPPPPKA